MSKTTAKTALAMITAIICLALPLLAVSADPAAEPDAVQLPSSERKPSTRGHAVPADPEELPERAHIDSPLLERLTLPASLLPRGCTFKPVDAAMGAAPIRVDSNPMITSDRQAISFASIFVMPPTPEEEAAWEAEASTLQPEDVMKHLEAAIMKRTATVRAAYIAIYESSRGAETGIFALEFTEPLSSERREELSIEGPGGAVVAGEYVAAAVWTDDPVHACLDAVRAHVEAMLGE